MASNFVDRRLNPSGKSLGNRQRFLSRARTQIRDAVQKSLKDAPLNDMDKERQITIPARGVEEPTFNTDPNTGTRNRVLPGNKAFEAGDRVRKPPRGEGAGGKDAADSGDSEDDITFTLSQDEVLDILIEDLELPNLSRTRLTQLTEQKPRRAGVSADGAPNNLNVARTMRQALGRRIALKRPRTSEERGLEAEIEALEAASDADPARLEALRAELDLLRAGLKRIAFIDPIDIRYNAFQPQPKATSAAVMFCLMDVSGSMGAREKDLAKRFFLLLHLFLKRRYERVSLVFIRHTHQAQEVDEQTFFYSRQSGGTVVSTALNEMLKVQRARFPASDWNIYVAQASDGYTQTGDAQTCVELLNKTVLPISRYYAYIEILDEREFEVFGASGAGAELWRAYRTVEAAHENFAAKRIARPRDIYPVFRELFARREDAAA
ncbi:MAG: YeaH/YhbH family protein [Maricaulaceae bacterium]